MMYAVFKVGGGFVKFSPKLLADKELFSYEFDEKMDLEICKAAIVEGKLIVSVDAMALCDKMAGKGLFERIKMALFKRYRKEMYRL